MQVYYQISSLSTSKNIAVIIPAFNEESAIGKVVADIPRSWVRDIIVVDNGSTDQTSRKASEAGAIVLQEPRKGYGFACLKGINYLQSKFEKPDIIVFMDGDYADKADDLPRLVEPIIEEKYDLVIGSRTLGKKERGSITPQQVFGNWLATRLIRWMYGLRFTDLGPYRAIRFQSLIDLNMQDKTYGWTVEMQVKAAKYNLRTTEVAVDYRKRIGTSKVSGTIKGTLMAGYKILTTILKYR